MRGATPPTLWTNITDVESVFIAKTCGGVVGDSFDDKIVAAAHYWSSTDLNHGSLWV